MNSIIPLGRRAFLKAGVLCLVPAASALLADEQSAEKPLRIGLVTDLHHADKPTAGTRHYRETHGKLEEAAAKFEERRIDLVVELGDLIDAAADVATEQRYLKTINGVFSQIAKDRHYVLGNHCVDTLTKEEFLGGVERERSYFSFDRGGFHFVVLDACFRGDGEPYGRKNFHWTDANIPPAELEWLEDELKSAGKPCVVFAHQRLDVSNNHGVKNCEAVRKTLEASGRVLAVFQGHSHQNDYKEIGGIHYATLAAMVEGPAPESNGYSTLDLRPDGSLQLTGFRRQADYAWR
jgi:alkaline phosphatase